MRQPQRAQRQNPVHRGLRLRFIHPDHRPRLLPLQQRPARIRRAEALLQVHRGAKAVRLPVAPVVSAAQHPPFQRAQIAHPRCLAGCRRSPVLVRQKLQRSRPRLPKPVGRQTQHAFARSPACNCPTHSPNDVSLFAPQMQRASPVLSGQRVLRRPHVEHDLAVFHHHGLRMFCEERLQRHGNLLRRLFRLGRAFAGANSGRHHGAASLALRSPDRPCHQPSRSRSRVMCATWCRECHAYSSAVDSTVLGPRSGCL